MKSGFAPKTTIEQLVYIFVLLICFVLGIGALAKGWVEFVALQTRSVITQGFIVERDVTAKGVHQVTYQFDAPDSDGIVKTFEFLKFVGDDMVAGKSSGDPVSVMYLPGSPHISNIAGNRFLLFGDIVWVTIILGIVETFVGLLLVLHIKDWGLTIPKTHHT